MILSIILVCFFDPATKMSIISSLLGLKSLYSLLPPLLRLLFSSFSLIPTEASQDSSTTKISATNARSSKLKAYYESVRSSPVQ